jgi:hypothetical protein
MVSGGGCQRSRMHKTAEDEAGSPAALILCVWHARFDCCTPHLPVHDILAPLLLLLLLVAASAVDAHPSLESC